MTKKNILFFTLSFFLIITSKGQGYLELQKKGDSLFFANDFYNASKVYDSIINLSVASPSLFLKLAYMHETSENITELMVVLNKYYKIYPSANIQVKIEEIAREYQLKGYNYSDFDYFAALYRQYYYFILLFFLVASGLYFSHLISKKIRGNSLSFRPLFFILMLMLLVLVVNFNLQPARAIIKNPNTFIMTAPAAGSNLLEISSSGHRVNVLGQVDVWVEVEYENKVCYIKENDLEFIY